VRIANFNDNYLGAAPDVGAAEAGAAAMLFGLAASTGNSGGTAIPTAPPDTTAPPTPPGTTTVLPTSFGMDSSGYTISAGQSVTFTATIPGNGGTASFQANGAAIGGCAAAAVTGGIATCTTASLAKGSYSVRAVYSGSGNYGAGIAGPITQSVIAGSLATPASYNVQGLWWGSAAESGWGLNLTHQGNIIFATWFTYDAAGNGQWLVMSDGERTGDNSYSGTLYRTSGPAFNAAVFDPARVTRTAVGTATLSFSDGNRGTFVATVDGVAVTKSITRMVYDAQLPTCATGGSAGASVNYQDLWWRPGGTESGWGVNLTHQGDILFMTWFTYDTDGKGMWLLASNVTRTSAGNYSGALYRSRGPAFDTASWNPSNVGLTTVGSVSFSFSDADNGTFSYTVNGVSQAKPITRMVYSTPKTVCR
jgi:hypothetical protein